MSSISDRKKSIDKTSVKTSPAKTTAKLPLSITVNSAATTPTAANLKSILSPLGSGNKTPTADLKPMARERANSVSSASPSTKPRSNSIVLITPPGPITSSSSALNSILTNANAKLPSPSPPTKTNSPPRSIHRTSFTDPNSTTLHSLGVLQRPVSPSPNGLSTHLPKPSELGTRSPSRSSPSNSPRNVVDKNGGFFNKPPPLSPNSSDNCGSPGFKQVRSSQVLYKPSTISSIDYQLESKNPAMLASMFHIAKLIANAPDAKSLISVLKNETAKMVQANACRVILVSLDGLHSTESEVVYPYGSGIVGECQISSSILHVESPASDSRFILGLDSFATPMHLLCVPIQAQSVGLVAILTCESDSPFSDDNGAALYSLGEFIAGSLKASSTLEATNKLYAASTRVNGRVEIMLEIAKALMSEHRLSVLVSFIISEVPELLDCDRCTLFFVDKRSNELIVTRGASHGRRVSTSTNVNLEELDKKPSPATLEVTLTKSAEEEDSTGSLPFRKGAGEIRFPMSKGIAGHVATTGETVNIVDAYADSRFNPSMDIQSGYKTRNILCVGMCDSNNEVIGVIQCLNKNAKSPGFDESDEVLLKMFAACAAIAVKNSRLFAEAQKALKKSDALLEVTHAISQELVFAPLVNIIVTKIQQLLQAERCTVFLIDEDTQTMYSTASMSHGMGSSLPIDNNLESVVRFPIDKGIVGHVGKTGSVLNLVDAYTDERFNRSFDKETGFRTKALLTVPIINNKQKVIGVAQVLNKKNGGYFNDEDIKLLVAFTEQIAIAFGNSRLFHETKKALNGALREQRNLKFMLEFTRNLCSEMQTSSVVASLKFQVKELLNADNVQIFLMDRESGQFFRFDEDIANNRERYDPSVGIAGKCIKTAQPILLGNGRVCLSPDYNSKVDSRDNCVPNSVLVVPIIYDPTKDPSKKEENEEKPDEIEKPRVLGCITSIFDKKNGSFSTDDQRLVTSLCFQSSMALVKSEQLAKLVESANKENAAHNDDKTKGDMFDLDDNFESFQFKMTDFQMVETIGSGSYGEVYAAKLHGKIVAVKKLNSRGLKSEQIDSFCSEASLMCQLKHPNVVQFIGAVTQPPDLCIITEYCSKGSLCDLLLNPQIKIDFAKKLQIMIESAAGMQYLHDSNPVILHRDLKSDNLLVTNDWSIKVADFGLSRFRSDQKVMTQVGTPMWMAPEVIMGEKYTEKADVYSFGIIIWEILTRLEPYEDKEAMQIVVEVVNNQLRPNMPPGYDDCPLLPLMKDCWAQEPQKRPSFKIVGERLQKISMQTQGTHKWS